METKNISIKLIVGLLIAILITVTAIQSMISGSANESSGYPLLDATEDTDNLEGV